MPAHVPVILSEAELTSIERELGHTLPADYREFLRDYGGVVTYTGVTLSYPNGPGYGGCEGFFGLMPENPFGDLVTQYRFGGEGWPPELLPIASGDNGYMCLVISGEEKGAVYFWHGGQGEGREHLYYVAASFDELIGLLE